MMQTRPIGRTGIDLSVVGLGTVHLQMLPEQQAIDTLVRGFELGVNWIHTAPDYGGIDPWIAKAIATSGREIKVLSAGPAHTRDLHAFFEQACHVYRTPRLALYGLSGIEDLEWHGENVWGTGGMIDILQRKKAEGRLGGIYCSTHASADYVVRLIESGAFDAIMLAWNPLEFHQQSHFFARAKIGRDYEDLREYRERVFPLAAERGVSLLIMKPFAGGLLCRSRALPPHDWFAGTAEPIDPGDVLRMILDEPGVSAVVPGASSVREAEEDARAGHAPLHLPADRRARIVNTVAAMRTLLCSRCGKCETTCSRSLSIPAMFREAYIWTARNETTGANPTENYFDIHPDDALACSSCADQTCTCSEGVPIPLALGRVHHRMLGLREARQHPGPSAAFPDRTVAGRHRVLVLTSEVPDRLAPREDAVARFLVQNVGGERWMAEQHTTDASVAVGIGVVIDGRLTQVVPLRNTVCPDEKSQLAFTFRAPRAPGRHDLQFCFMPLGSRDSGRGTVFHSCSLSLVPQESPPVVLALARRAARLLHGASLRAPTEPSRTKSGRHGALTGTLREYGVQYLEHSFPHWLKTSVTYGVRLAIANTGSLTWHAAPTDGHRTELHVILDDALLAVLPLPDGDVPPGGQATVHLPFRAPDFAGSHRVRVELVHQGIGPFASHGVDPWLVDLQVIATPMTETTRLFELERRHNPWHYDPLLGIPESRDGHPFPLFISRAKGCRAWDAEGHEYLDYTMGWGSTILGHADDRVQDAVREMLDTGAVLPFPHPLEMDVSRMLLDEFPGNDMVVFGKNGSDMCTVASRLARVVTGRTTILSCGFHGWQDFALDYFTFPDCGIPDRPGRVLHKFTFNDRDGFFSLYERHKDDLAAVMIEPAGPLLSEEAGLGGEADPAFLGAIAEAARKAGALLIFDEIITGFRYRHGSVQKATGVVPDLTCLGKALGSGMPLSALVGPYRVFLPHFHKAHFNATFKSEVYSLAAARAALRIYREQPVADHIWRHGERLRLGVADICEDLGVAGGMTGPPFRMAFVFRETDPMRRRLKRTLLMQELLKQRIITVSGMVLPSWAHDDEALGQTLAGFARALDVVARADRRDDLHHLVELVPF